MDDVAEFFLSLVFQMINFSSIQNGYILPGDSGDRFLRLLPGQPHLSERSELVRPRQQHDHDHAHDVHVRGHHGTFH